ncbi:hypothetical protein K0M31_011912, partial [Melipona bicolor]
RLFMEERNKIPCVLRNACVDNARLRARQRFKNVAGVIWKAQSSAKRSHVFFELTGKSRGSLCHYEELVKARLKAVSSGQSTWPPLYVDLAHESG